MRVVVTGTPASTSERELATLAQPTVMAELVLPALFMVVAWQVREGVATSPAYPHYTPLMPLVRNGTMLLIQLNKPIYVLK